MNKLKNLKTTILQGNREPNSFYSELIRIYSIVGLEAFIWIFSLIYLMLINVPSVYHFTICPLANLGIDFCPGCGLGNSISYLFMGDISASLNSHPLGIIALPIILIRIISLIKSNRRRLCQTYFS